MYLPKHVEQFPDINKLCNVASCWIYIGSYFIFALIQFSVMVNMQLLFDVAHLFT